MNRLWLFYFPLLFLPNLGHASATGYGTLEFSDFLIVPYLALVTLAATWGQKLHVGRITPIMGIFIAWAIFSTITISLRYGYANDYFITFGMLKTAKMGLYGLAGVLTARALSQESARRAFDWSILAAAAVCGVSLWLTKIGPSAQRITETGQGASLDSGVGYSATNGTSVMAAILVVFISAKLLTDQGSHSWRLVAPGGLGIIVAGSAVSDGRGGWLAALAGTIYLLFRIGPNRKMIAYVASAAIIIAFLYQAQPEFRHQIDATLFVSELEETHQGTQPLAVDDSGRIETWDNEIRKWPNAPVMGTGMFHRGGQSGLWTTGSHNFWLQMMLELGIVGLMLMTSLLVTMWRQATSLRKHHAQDDIPLKAAIITMIVGGLGGEYFYGGIIMFTALAVYAPTGGVKLWDIRDWAPHMARPGVAASPVASGQGPSPLRTMS